jgi:hypothetical protein
MFKTYDFLEAPVPMPQDGNFYEWNEETLSWDLTNNQIGA